jgi:hypothetical protein
VAEVVVDLGATSAELPDCAGERGVSERREGEKRKGRTVESVLLLFAVLRILLLLPLLTLDANIVIGRIVA